MKWLIVNTNKKSRDLALYWNAELAEWDIRENATIFDTKALNHESVKDGSFVKAPKHIIERDKDVQKKA